MLSEYKVGSFVSIGLWVRLSLLFVFLSHSKLGSRPLHSLQKQARQINNKHCYRTIAEAYLLSVVECSN
jgi:hypothetical protein